MSDKIRLVRTCLACPEQYDAYLGDKMVGYLRLRYGDFTVDYPECGGETIYHAWPHGFGLFDADERDYYLRFAVDAILKRIKDGPQSKSKPEAPDVEYTVEGIETDDGNDLPF